MGVRTRGYTKVSQKSGEVGDGNKKKALVATKECAEKKVKSGVGASEVDDKASSEPLKPEISKPTTRVANNIARSPLKLRTPSSMASSARKLKQKHKKLVQSASKIWRSNKTRRAGRLEVQDKPRPRRVKGITLPSRISTRTCARRSSKEEIPEAPLRCVELIQRPFELREPATKLLFLASLGLYPRTAESDMIPIVVVRELSCSPGKKNGVRKSLELPLMPCYKKYLNLANHDKQSISENIMPGRKQPKRDNRKASPATKNDGNGMKKSVSGRKTPTNSASPTNAAECPKPKQGQSLADNGKLSTQQQQQVKKKTVPSKANRGIASVGTTANAAAVPIPKQANTLDLTASAAPVRKISSGFPFTQSLLKSNISALSESRMTYEPMTGRPELSAFNFPDEVEAPGPITTESLCYVKQAMNLIMSNVTILPSTSSTLPSRKRLASDNSNLNIEEIINSNNFINNNANMFAEKKPVKKKQKTCKAENNSRSSHPVVVPMPNSVNVCNSISVFLQNTDTNYPQSQNTDEALNLCMKKRNSEPATTPVIQLPPPKLQMNSNINIQKLNINGSKPLNLIIPRPPPLTKAPLEATNIANCTQNINPVAVPKKKVQAKRTKKTRTNNNHLNQSNLQIQDTLPILPPLSMSVLPLPNTTDTTVQAKSLLKCMNGEENTCAREVGESLDSVKTMLSRLQTSIGPAVNGVRLITIE